MIEFTFRQSFVVLCAGILAVNGAFAMAKDIPTWRQRYKEKLNEPDEVAR